MKDQSSLEHRVAIFGCGSIGRRHARNLVGLGVRDIVAFDPSPEARRAFALELGLPVTDDVQALWNASPSLAVVASPSNLHTAQALEALQHGCHLFVEKPLSHDLNGLDLLEKEASTRGLVTMVACNMRFHPGPARVKALLEERTIGEPISARVQSGSYLPSWRPQQDYRESYSASTEWGGALLDCIHEVDLALWYMGPGKVVGSALAPARCLGLATDGVVEMILRHHSGALSSIHLNFVQRDYRRCCAVVGTEGTLYWDFSKAEVLQHGPKGDVVATYLQPPGWQLNQMYVDQFAHLMAAVRSGSETVNPLSTAASTLRVALQAREMGTEKPQ
jgi:predicted dehydrogenase